jgi:inward rectifier potassium channel
VRLGERTRWRDLYHRLLVMHWPRFLGVMALVYFLGNVVFALPYLVGDNAIANARPGAFGDAFFFSVQTMAMIGYGVMYPQTFYANVLMTLETLLGMVTVAIGAGLVFARVSRPTARVLLSTTLARSHLYKQRRTLRFSAQRSLDPSREPHHPADDARLLRRRAGSGGFPT